MSGATSMRRTKAITRQLRSRRALRHALSSRGVLLVRQRGQETRCFFRDPDGHLFEISQFG
ncbi:MAG TPA: VOC family protein [Solirubrobacteraceae bacterium]|nr:VOC family protein [Solirubrobacteraceae bacterium]